MSSSRDGIPFLLVIVTTFATPMAYIQLGIVDMVFVYTISGWTFIFGCVDFYSGALHYGAPAHDPRFVSFLTLAAVWLSVAFFLAALFFLRIRFRISIMVILFTLVLQVSAPLLLLSRYPAIFVIPLPIPSVVALIGLLVFRLYLPYRNGHLGGS